ncbi:MAG TPA: hypothetical protein VHP58_03080 [Alphaproteobacteria bacterium]|nr:hypothetical protein [Alphaproteobacteria bacterium]
MYWYNHRYLFTVGSLLLAFAAAPLTHWVYGGPFDMVTFIGAIALGAIPACAWALQLAMYGSRFIGGVACLFVLIGHLAAFWAGVMLVDPQVLNAARLLAPASPWQVALAVVVAFELGAFALLETMPRRWAKQPSHVTA